MLLAPLSDEAVRAGSLISMLAVAAFVGSNLLGRYARAVRLVIAGLYIAAVLVFAGYYLFIQ